jgi:hypothetical protein
MQFRLRWPDEMTRLAALLLCQRIQAPCREPSVWRARCEAHAQHRRFRSNRSAPRTGRLTNQPDVAAQAGERGKPSRPRQQAGYRRPGRTFPELPASRAPTQAEAKRTFWAMAPIHRFFLLPRLDRPAQRVRTGADRPTRDAYYERTSGEKAGRWHEPPLASGCSCRSCSSHCLRVTASATVSSPLRRSATGEAGDGFGSALFVSEWKLFF